MTGEDRDVGEEPVVGAAARAAAMLAAARRTRQPCAPVRSIIGEADVDLAYAVQQAGIAADLAAGRRRVGHKIGLTSPAVQRQLGVDQPDFGVLLDDMRVADGAVVPLDRLIAPKVEAEIAFVMQGDLASPQTTVDDVLAATRAVLPAIEIVDSRVRDWDIRITDTIADNASSGLFVLGTVPVDPASLDLAEVGMTLYQDERQVSAGSGFACLGHPLAAVAWLARTLARRDAPVSAGDIVLSGALGPMISVAAAARYRAHLTGLGDVTVEFA